MVVGASRQGWGRPVRRFPGVVVERGGGRAEGGGGVGGYGSAPSKVARARARSASTPVVATTDGGAGEGGETWTRRRASTTPRGKSMGGRGRKGHHGERRRGGGRRPTRLGRTAEAVGGRVLPNDSPDGRRAPNSVCYARFIGCSHDKTPRGTPPSIPTLWLARFVTGTANANHGWNTWSPRVPGDLRRLTHGGTRAALRAPGGPRAAARTRGAYLYAIGLTNMRIPVRAYPFVVLCAASVTGHDTRGPLVGWMLDGESRQRHRPASNTTTTLHCIIRGRSCVELAGERPQRGVLIPYKSSRPLRTVGLVLSWKVRPSRLL